MVRKASSGPTDILDDIKSYQIIVVLVIGQSKFQAKTQQKYFSSKFDLVFGFHL